MLFYLFNFLCFYFLISSRIPSALINSNKLIHFIFNERHTFGIFTILLPGPVGCSSVTTEQDLTIAVAIKNGSALDFNCRCVRVIEFHAPVTPL